MAATVRLTVKVTAPSGTVIIENAATMADTFDPNMANNTATVSIKGSIASKQKISGAYKILHLCQGAAEIQVGNKGPIGLTLVVVNGEHEVLFIEGDTNTLLSGSLQQ